MATDKRPPGTFDVHGEGVAQVSGDHHLVVLRRWRWPLRFLLAVVVPACLIFLGEVGLRVAGYGYPTDFFVEVAGQNYYGGNRKFGWRFFPRAISREPLFLKLPAQKTVSTYRIFVLGASAAMGVPGTAFSFSRMLEVMLEDQFPQINFEILNTAITATNSHVVVPIAQECAEYEGDLFIVYLGNNEVIGPYGLGSGANRSPASLVVIRLGIWFRTMKIGQLFQQIAGKVSGQDKILEKWGGMEMYSKHTLAVDDPALEKIYAHYRQNLVDICRATSRSGTKIILSTVAVNLRDSPPFASLHRSDLTRETLVAWEATYTEGIRLESAGRHAEASARYEEASRLDDRYAELQFRLGRVKLLLGDTASAYEHFVRARELDGLRFRADERINEIVREVAASHLDEQVYLVDTERYLQENDPSPYNIPGKELFFEHVHLTLRGHYLITVEMFQNVIALLPPEIQVQGTADPKPLSLAECMARLTYTSWNEYNILSQMYTMMVRYPFTNQLDHQATVARMQGELQRLKDEATQETLQRTYHSYAQAVARKPDDLLLHANYVKLLHEMGMQRAADTQWNWLLQHVPTRE